VSKTSSLKPTLNQADVDLLMAGINKRFDGVDKRFTDIDKRFTDIDKRFTDIDKRFTDIDKRFADIDRQFVVVDLNSTEIKNRFDEMEKQQSIKYDNVITLLDDIIGELKVIREEHAVFAQHSKNHTDQLEENEFELVNHEKRINKLELTANFA
jgi:hypothetical protein